MSYTFDVERRNDPEIRAKCEERHKARQAMMLHAAQVLNDLVDEMRPLNEGGDDAMYGEMFDKIRALRYRVDSDSRFMQNIGSETYIGNLAAGRLGDHFAKGGK